MTEFNVGTVWKAIQTAGRILNDRVLRLAALMMTFVIFLYALYLLTWVALAIAATFAVTVFIPCLTRTGKQALPGETSDGS